jgi:pimeloyl-ACP methyl ester carboxylesterase
MNTFLKVLLLIILVILVAGYFLVKPDISLDYLKNQYATGASDFVYINGMEVHYRKQGVGDQNLVLLHGTGASLHTWEGWVGMMQDSFTIYTVDLPAFGLTGPHPDRDYSMDAYVQFVEEFVYKMGLNSFSLAGNSLGGGIAWNYTALNPDKIEGLILIDASGYPTEGNIGIFELARNPLIGPLLKYVTPRNLIKKNLLQVYADDAKVTESLVDRYYQLARRKGNRQAFIDRAKSHSENKTYLLPTIKNPTLIMWGGKDDWNGIVEAYKFQEDLSHDSLIIYENLGHVPMEEDPFTTARDASNFLKNIQANIGS